jgi:hypothetical protein
MDFPNIHFVIAPGLLPDTSRREAMKSAWLIDAHGAKPTSG